MKKFMRMIILLTAGILLVACGDDASTGDTDQGSGNGGESKTFGIVFKNTGNPVGDRTMDGFEDALNELGHTTIRKAPDQPTAEMQIQMIQELIDQGVDGIAVAANDPDALQPVLQNAMDQGISVVSYDSPTNPASRQVHIEQATDESIGIAHAEAILDLTDGSGDFAVLSSTSTATGQNNWIAAMEKEMEKDEYADLNLVRIAYGDDLRDKSTSETEGLLQTYPDLKVIASPTTVGLAAAGNVLLDQGRDDVLATGLGLPSEVANYIHEGVIPYAIFWNPMDIGYLAAYTLEALSNDEITGEPGDSYNVGELGEREIEESDDGGTKAVLGDPMRFDQDNIDEWAEQF